MKSQIKILIGIGALASLFTACKKYDGDTYDFSNSTKHYMRFATVNNVKINADTVEIDSIIGTETVKYYYHVEGPGIATIETRVGFAEPISITINKKPEGSNDEVLNFTYPQFVLNNKLEINGSAADIANTTTEDESTGTLTLISATAGNYGPLVTGYPTATKNVTINYTYYKTDVRHLVN